MLFRNKLKAWRGETLLGTLWVIQSLCKIFGLKLFYRSFVLYLVKGLNIFDRAYYLDVNNDVRQSGQLPLRHYVFYGDKEGRSPMALFDPNYYRNQVPGLTKHVNTLLHYAYIGRYRKISPSPWFDVAYYLDNNKDVARSGYDPLVHYLKWGGTEGRSPCQQFDGSYYLRSYPDVAAMGINPLIHYLFSGRQEGRSTLPEHGSNIAMETNIIDLPLLALPEEDSWLKLAKRAAIKNTEIDVIVPVYKARNETLRCLYSVLKATCNTPFKLIVINDASPDQELVADLHRLAAIGLFTLLENTENRGFVYSVNRGIELYKKRNKVILNSDTEVYDGWLDRLHRAAYRHLNTGTVTPLSNNATICSYPHFLHDNPYPLELSYAEMDALAATVNADIEIEAPTGVGFCMYIKHACLKAVGLFDEKTFGKGYGEENDFCQKAISKGWRNVIAADLYVRHLGSASFQGEKAKRVHDALKIIDKRYPKYRKEIDSFIHRDPLKEARCRLDAARMKRLSKDKNVLIICHNRGGGSERRVQEDIFDFNQLGYGIFTLRPMNRQPSHVLLGHPVIRSFPNINPFALAETSSLAATLKELNITEIHTHSLVDFTPDAPEHIGNLVRSLGIRLEVNLHDYKVICPRINLVDENGLYCGEPEETECNRCLADRGSDFNALNIQAWRAAHEQELINADKVLVPDEDVANRLSYYFPAIKLSIEPHENIDLSTHPVITPTLNPEQKLRIVVIGAIGKLKGFHVIMNCAKHAKQQGFLLEFIVMGYTMNDKLIEETGVYITGKYQEHEALDKLNSLNPHVVWLPALWPETYSYTLSLALKAQLPVFAFDIGAIARRIKESGTSDTLMPLSWSNSPATINQQFEKFRTCCIQSSITKTPKIMRNKS